MSTVLIIDDEEQIRRVCRLALKRAGHAVIEAATGEAGLQMAREQIPDLILCDVQLGAHSGLDVLVELRRDAVTATTPLILITASVEETVMRRGMDLGADDYLRKPFSPEELCAAVGARLNKQEVLEARAERALRENEARFRAIATAALDAIIMMEPEGGISFWNPAAERIFGYTAAEVMGTTLHKLIVPEELRAAHERAFPGFQATGQGAAVGRVVELVALRKGGQRFSAEISLTAVQLHERWHAVGIVRDVTEQRATTHALQRERILLRTLVDALPDCIYAKDREAQKTLANLADVRSLGAEREEEVLGKTDFEMLHRQTAAACYADDMGVILRGEPVRERQELIVNGRGERHWMETTKLPLRDEKGGIVGLVGIGHDITERRQAEGQLRKLSKAVEQSPASVVITDTSGLIEYVNPRFCEVTGYEPSDVLGKNPRVLKSGEMPKEKYQELWGRLTSGLEWRGELHNRKKNGELFWELAILSPIKDDLGRITHFLAVKEDITERKRAEQERTIMELHLRQAQKLESIGQLAAGIAHEINTPMQYVGDNLRFLQDSFAGIQRLLGSLRELMGAMSKQPQLAAELAPIEAVWQAADIAYVVEEIPKAIAQSLQGTQRVTGIVQAMKEFSHPGTDQRTAVDLNHAIESTLTVARNEYKYVAELEVELDPGLPLVPCLPGEFNQVILNLVVNASYAISEVVGKDPTKKGRITVSTRRKGDWVEVRVADTGAGIPEAIRTRIYDPFFTTKPVGKGSGQGLAIARSVVVDKHSGSIDCESEVGRGTTFIIRLPLETRGAAEAPPSGLVAAGEAQACAASPAEKEAGL